MADLQDAIDGAVSRGLVKLTVYQMRDGTDEAWAATCLFAEGCPWRYTHATRRTASKAAEAALAQASDTDDRDIFG